MRTPAEVLHIIEMRAYLGRDRTSEALRILTLASRDKKAIALDDGQNNGLA